MAESNQSLHSVSLAPELVKAWVCQHLFELLSPHLNSLTHLQSQKLISLPGALQFKTVTWRKSFLNIL